MLNILYPPILIIFSSLNQFIAIITSLLYMYPIQRLFLICWVLSQLCCTALYQIPCIFLQPHGIITLDKPIPTAEDHCTSFIIKFTVYLKQYLLCAGEAISLLEEGSIPYVSSDYSSHCKTSISSDLALITEFANALQD